ncbi:MAG: amidohydrolase family protein [Firmicutes bacterium]|nr:amidohydrolase family protein [Bacillota bacterium]
MSALSIIDSRNRPPFLHPFYGEDPDSRQAQYVAWLSKRLGASNPDHFKAQRTPEEYFHALDAAGIAQAVVVGRNRKGIRISNERVKEVIDMRPDRLIGIAAVDPLEDGLSSALEQTTHAIKDLGLKGLNLEPGYLNEPLFADDPLFFPLYELLSSLNVPVFFMTGPSVPLLRYTHPEMFGHIARVFPHLKILVTHGAYPFVQEMIGLAFRFENIFIAPDLYQFSPGTQPFIEAANGVLQDQYVFGTGYPFLPMKETVEQFLRCGIDESVLSKVLHANAQRLLDL